MPVILAIVLWMGIWAGMFTGFYNLPMLSSSNPFSFFQGVRALFPLVSLYFCLVWLFKERTTAQAFAMKIVQIMPISNVSNVQMFRMTNNGMPTCELKAFPLNNNQNQMVLLWEMVMNFECVFTTEGSYGDATPLAPKNLAATEGLYSDKVTLTWTASVGATGYEVWRATTNSYASASKIATLGAVVTYDDETTTAETTYYYWLKATNASGKSVYCSPVTGHTTTA